MGKLINISIILISIWGCKPELPITNSNSEDVFFVQESEHNFDTSSVSYSCIYENTNGGQELIRNLNNCECARLKDTTFFYFTHKVGWSNHLLNIKVVNDTATVWVKIYDDISHRGLKLKKIDLKRQHGRKESTDNQNIDLNKIKLGNYIAGNIEFQYDTILDSMLFKFNIAGNFICKVEKATQQWYKYRQKGPNDEYVFK